MYLYSQANYGINCLSPKPKQEALVMSAVYPCASPYFHSTNATKQTFKFFLFQTGNSHRKELIYD